MNSKIRSTIIAAALAGFTAGSVASVSFAKAADKTKVQKTQVKKAEHKCKDGEHCNDDQHKDGHHE